MNTIIARAAQVLRTPYVVHCYAEYELLPKGGIVYVKLKSNEAVYEQREEQTWALYDCDYIIDFNAVQNTETTDPRYIWAREGYFVDDETRGTSGRKSKTDNLPVKEIQKRAKQGESIAAIARSLGVSRPTIYECLKV